MQASDKLYHLSYGMVELPSGKMKSREGTVVDADDLLNEMVETARKISEELGKLEGKSDKEKQELYETIGIGALRYFILKVDPKKRMIFNPQESVDMHGHTAPFIQYTHARICSILRKAGEQPNQATNYLPSEKEIEMIALLSEFPKIVIQAEQEYNPSVVANYVYELAKEFNQFYHEYPIATEVDVDARTFRLNLTAHCGKIIRRGLGLLCIGAPEKM
jgi:arginyl-tRNA synthetase